MKIGYLMQEGPARIDKNPFGGPSTHVRQVIKELKNLGHEVCLMAKLDNQIWQTNDLENYEAITIRWLDKGPLRLLEKTIRRIQASFGLPYVAFFNSVRFAYACRQVLSDCDLFYERMGWMGYGGGLAARQLGIPLILEVNGDNLSEMETLGIAPQGVQRWLSLKLMEKVINSATHIVASGDGWRQRYIENWNINPGMITTVENGSELVNLLDRNQLRAFRSPDSDVTNLLYLGGFQPWQGVTVLLQAFAKAIASGAKIRLVLIGSGPDLKASQHLASELNIDEFVTFTGHMHAHQFASYLTEADIGMSPYCGWTEFSGLKLFDYKAAGLATIASGHNGQPATLAHGRTGWIVPPGDQEALCEAILYLNYDVELRKRIGREARIEAENCHGWQHTAQQLNQLFFQVVTK